MFSSKDHIAATIVDESEIGFEFCHRLADDHESEVNVAPSSRTMLVKLNDALELSWGALMITPT
jgi:hypothetical protein